MPPGGRFNIGKSISYSAYFPALYIAESFETAFSEKFNSNKDDVTGDGLSGTDLALARPESFSYLRLKGVIKKVIDIRKLEPIEAFYNSISTITMPATYRERAKQLGISMEVVNSSEWLRTAIYDPNYQQWDFWIDQPSPSQWFGHYVKMAGIHGIVYSSVRSGAGVNLALFPENFEGSESYVELMDEADFVNAKNRRIDGGGSVNFIKSHPFTESN
jgi:RES domain